MLVVGFRVGIACAVALCSPYKCRSPSSPRTIDITQKSLVRYCNAQRSYSVLRDMYASCLQADNRAAVRGAVPVWCLLAGHHGLRECLGCIAVRLILPICWGLQCGLPGAADGMGCSVSQAAVPVSCWCNSQQHLCSAVGASESGCWTACSHTLMCYWIHCHAWFAVNMSHAMMTSAAAPCFTHLHLCHIADGVHV